MKKLSSCFLVLFASFILAIQSFGQASQSDSIKFQGDSVKTDLNLSSEVVKKLDNKDIVEIIKYREKLAQEKEMAKAKMNLPNLTSESTATIWSILIILLILSLFAIPYYFNLKKVKARQQIIAKLIEKDREIPKELLAKPQKTRRSDLHKGIVLIAFGLSLCIVIFILKIDSNFWTIGLIPMFIGIGYAISFKLDQSFKRKSEID
jgi:predicted PurR-regulated permease PerM